MMLYITKVPQTQSYFCFLVQFQHIEIITLASLHSINLSPFTKDFRVWEQYNESSLFFYLAKARQNSSLIKS